MLYYLNVTRNLSKEKNPEWINRLLNENNRQADYLWNRNVTFKHPWNKRHIQSVSCFEFSFIVHHIKYIHVKPPLFNWYKLFNIIQIRLKETTKWMNDFGFFVYRIQHHLRYVKLLHKFFNFFTYFKS